MDLTIPVTLEFAPSLNALAAADRAGSLARRVGTGLSTILAELGLAGQAQVQVQIANSHYAVRLRVHRVIRPYPPRLLQRVWASMAPPGDQNPPPGGSRRTFPDTHPYRLSDDWLVDYVKGIAAAGDQADWEPALEFVARLVCEVVREYPSCLLGPAQIDAYAGSAQEYSDEAAAHELRTVLELLLDLGVSLVKRERQLPFDAAIRRRVPARGSSPAREKLSTEFGLDGRGKRPAADLAEAAFARLRSPRIEVHAHPGYLDALFSGTTIDRPVPVYAKEADSGFHELFRMMEDGLFYELGITLPRLVWVPSTAMPHAMIAVRINDRLGLPMPGLQPGEIFVNETVRRLKLLGLDGYPALSPANGSECAVLPESTKQAVEGAGLTTWDAVGYVIFSVAAEIRRCAHRLLSSADAEHLLAQLETVSPELIRALVARYPLEDLTRVLRALLEEGLSIRNLSAIAEQLLEYEAITVDAIQYIVFDPRLAMLEPAPRGSANYWLNYLEHVRSGLKYYITNKYYNYSRGPGTLLVYLLDPAIETQMAGWGIERHSGARRSASAEDERDAIRAAIRADARSAAGETRPIILTNSVVRRTVRDLIADELPDLPVVAYSELQPDINIKPVSRISLP